MFDQLDTVNGDLRQFVEGLDLDGLDGAAAAELIAKAAEGERLCVGIRLLAARRLEADNERARANWLAGATGATPGEAARDLEASEQLTGLDATEAALRDGELSVAQAREVASGASADPAAEAELLDLARHASVSELRARAKQVRAAAIPEADKNDKAHRERKLGSGSDPETAKGWLGASGPNAAVAKMLGYLEPWIQAEFAKARAEGRRESRAAYAFDALLAALAAAGRKDQRGAPVGPPAKVLVRVDAAALQRGHTVAGEMCEIDGLGPVPVDAVRELLPQAVIDVIVTNGVDVFNRTNLARRSDAFQQAVLDWVGGRCSTLGCSATRHLQIDHRIDWAKIRITELKNLDWLCVPCHRLKTHHGWSLVPGRGRRRLVPPGHPDHPAHAPPHAEAA
jgi:hypothetical protein